MFTYQGKCNFDRRGGDPELNFANDIGKTTSKHTPYFVCIMGGVILKKMILLLTALIMFLSASVAFAEEDYVDDIAFAQLVYLVTESTLLTSYVFVIKIIFTFASIFTATYIDCHKKKPILFITSSGQCIILLFHYFIRKIKNGSEPDPLFCDYQVKLQR